MNKAILIIGLFLIGFSCNNKDQNIGYDNAKEFFNEYSGEFLNSELCKHESGGRGGYDSFPYDSAGYTIVPTKSGGLFVVHIGNFLNKFNFPVNIQDQYRIGDLVLEESNYILNLESYNHSYIRVFNDSIEVNKHSTEKYVIPLTTFSQDPFEYVYDLEKMMEEYKIIYYEQINDWGIIKVYFSLSDYLIYFPNVNNIDENFMDSWDKKYKSGEKFDANWIYYKSD